MTDQMYLSADFSKRRKLITKQIQYPELPGVGEISAAARRLSYVPRWSICRVNNPQYLDQHVLMVMRIARQLFDQCVSQTDSDRPMLLVHLYEEALVHDLEEAWTGDIPTPSKVKEPRETENLARELIRAADLIETLLFAHEEIRSGNRDFEKIKHQVSMRINEWEGQNLHRETLIGYADELLKTHDTEIVL